MFQFCALYLSASLVEEAEVPISHLVRNYAKHAHAKQKMYEYFLQNFEFIIFDHIFHKWPIHSTCILAVWDVIIYCKHFEGMKL